MELLASAAHRTCSFEHERVYGIMQAFGDEFVVGKAREPVKSAGRSIFTLSELEDELAALVMDRYPVISQMFVDEEAPLLGRAWRICGRASLPNELVSVRS